MVRTFFDGVFSVDDRQLHRHRQRAPARPPTAVRWLSTLWCSPGATGPYDANGTDGNTSAGSLGVYYAFIQFAGFTMGKAVSQFDAPWTNYPGNNFDGLVGGSGTVTGMTQFTYTADFGQGVTASFSAEDPTAYYAGWQPQPGGAAGT